MRSARRTIVDYARACGFAKTDLADIEIAVGEALANAVEHGNQFCGYVGVSCTFAGEVLTVEIRDQGPGFVFAGVTERERGEAPSAARGFGISIMHRLMDEVHFDCGGKHVVRLTKRLGSNAELARREDQA